MAVKLTCELTTPCQGAFLLCLRGTFCKTGPTSQVMGGRLAASDFMLGANQTGEVPVALTTLGEQVASVRGGFQSDVLVDLRNYGIIMLPAPPGTAASLAPSGVTLRLTTDDPNFTPPGGAVMSCGPTLFAGPHTSCGFANAVYMAYMRSASLNTVDLDVTATSPATGQTYTMHCVGTSPHICSGQSGNRVIWY